jgi:hypothetical protein
MQFKEVRCVNSVIAGIGIVGAIVILLICMAAVTTTTTVPYSLITSVSTAKAQQMIEVKAGGGNAAAPLNQFIPQKVKSRQASL